MKHQLQIVKILRPYFERNITASVTASKTRINIKTVCRYFNKWSTIATEFEIRDSLERLQRERDRYISSIDEQILEAHEIKDRMDKEAKKFENENKPIPKYLLFYKLEISKFVSDLNERKIEFIMKATKVLNSERTIEPEMEITDEMIKEITVHIIKSKFRDNLSNIYRKNDLLREIINHFKCEQDTAQRIFDRMSGLGFDLCIIPSMGEFALANQYNLEMFAKMRRYLTDSEFSRIDAEIAKIRGE